MSLSKKISRKNNKSKRIVALIQARMGSSRLRNKAMLKIGVKTAIEIIVERLRACKNIDDIILSTSLSKENDVLEKHAKKIHLKVYRGPEEDLVTRHFEALKKFKADVMVRVTGDCPLVDPVLVDKMVNLYNNNRNIDFLTNCFPPTFPDGLDVDITPIETLERLDKEIPEKSMHRDFFVAYILERPSIFKVKNVKNNVNLFSMRWTLDYPEDLDFIRKVFLRLKHKGNVFSKEDVLSLIKSNPELLEVNKKRIDKTIFRKIRSNVYHDLLKKNEKLLIVDFDRTIIDLNVNWPLVKEKVSELYKPFAINLDFKKPLFERLRYASDKLKKIKNSKLSKSIYDKSLDIIANQELSALKQAKLIPGSKEFLEWLEKNKMEFCILSNNTSDVIKKAFNKHKLPKPRIVIGSNDVNLQKPDVEGLIKIIKACDISKDQCILIGDSMAELELGKKMKIKTLILTAYYKINNLKHNLRGNLFKSFEEIKKEITK